MADTASVQIVPPGALAFGMQLPVSAQTTTFVQPWERAAGPADMRRVAEACDRHGFFYLAVCDHVAIPRSRAGAMSTVWYDSIATLGFLAAATTRVRLLSYVYVVPYRHPLATAKAFATLDALSGGRVILGAGAGHLEDEFAALGVPFAGRGKRLDEALDLIAKALADEYPVHDGATWQVRDLGIAPRPVQRPRPPIWVGGSTPAAIKRAAAHGDGWLPQGVPAMGLPAAIELLRSHRARVRGDAPIEIGANSEWMYVGKPAFDVPPGTHTGVGEALAAPLRALRTLGVSHVGVRFRTRSCDELLDQVAAFAADVAPHLRD